MAREGAGRNELSNNENRGVATACCTWVTGDDFVRVFAADPQKGDAMQVTEFGIKIEVRLKQAQNERASIKVTVSGISIDFSD